MRGSSAAHGERQASALAAAHRAHTFGVHVRHLQHDLCELRRIQVVLPEQQFLWVVVVQAANDVAAQCPPLDPAAILRQAALSTTVQRGDGVAQRDVSELGSPVAGVPRVAVELQDRRVRPGCVSGLQQLGVDARATDAGEVKVRALGEGRLKVGRDDLDVRGDGPHLGQAALPVFVKICRPRVAALVGLQLFEGHVEHEWHAFSPILGFAFTLRSATPVRAAPSWRSGRRRSRAPSRS